MRHSFPCFITHSSNSLPLQRQACQQRKRRQTKHFLRDHIRSHYPAAKPLVQVTGCVQFVFELRFTKEHAVGRRLLTLHKPISLIIMYISNNNYYYCISFCCCCISHHKPDRRTLFARVLHVVRSLHSVYGTRVMRKSTQCN